MSARWRVLAILGIAVAASLCGTSALAGHGPVSDVLLNQNVFLPSEPKACPELADALTKVTDRAVNEGYPIKVAIIGSEADLGSAPQYFGRPQDYARFLGAEIGIYRPGVAGAQTNESLLTVMPAGFGFVRSGKAANVSLVVIGLEAPKGEHPDDLARAAIGAVRELAGAAGHEVPAPDTSCPEGGGTSTIAYVAAIVLVLLAAAVIALVARRRKPSSL